MKYRIIKLDNYQIQKYINLFGFVIPLGWHRENRWDERVIATYRTIETAEYVLDILNNKTK